MRSAKDLRIYAIEGGDFTGKSTQANWLAQNLKGLNIVIHFPRVKHYRKVYNRSQPSNVEHVYKQTSSILYNMDFWKKEFKQLFESKYLSYFYIKESQTYDKLRKTLIENINENAEDKLALLRDLYYLIANDTKITYFSWVDLAECVALNTETFNLTYFTNGTKPTDKENINRIDDLINDAIGNERVNIILDRFMISGYVYNELIPIEFIRNIENDKFFDGKTIDTYQKEQIVNKLFDDLINEVREHQIKADDKIANSLNALLQIGDCINWNIINMINPKFYNIRLINKNPELIAKMKENAKNDSSRKIDEYDVNAFIQKEANEIFTSDNHRYFTNSFIPRANIGTFDIGEAKYCGSDVERENIKSITKDIIAKIEKREAFYKNIYNRVSRDLTCVENLLNVSYDDYILSEDNN